jgi:hypothetical protein
MKAQSEFIGLVVIVMIISFGLVFFISYSTLSQKDDSRSQYVDKQIVINLNDALLSTTSNCRNQDVAFLLEHCSNYGTPLCDGKTGCELTEEIAQQVLDPTLATWKKTYEYSAFFEDSFTKEQKELVTVTNKPATCVVKSKTPSSFVFTADNGVIHTYFDIIECKTTTTPSNS